MQHFFYTILFVASLGIIGAIMNPSLVQQGAALVGLEFPPNSADSAEKVSCEDQVAKFLEQYQFANSQNAAPIPSTTIPTAIVPAPVPPSIPSSHVAPATPFPAPVAKTPVPAVHSLPIEPTYSPPNGNRSQWDSENTATIYPPPAIEYHLPPVPVQEPVTTPQQSIYVVAPGNHSPPQDAFSAAGNTVPRNFVAQSVPPQQLIQPPVTPLPQPIYPSQVSSPPPSVTTLQTPAVLIEEVPVHGTEMVARVGTQVILMGDILPKLRRMALKIVAVNLEKMSAEEQAKVTRKEIEQVTNAVATNLYPEMLQDQILLALVYSDYVSQQAREQRSLFDEKLGEEFDRKEIPEMLKEFRVENEAVLKRYLEQQLGSSLEKERRSWIREQIGRQWMNMSIQRATGDATQDEQMEFYERNQAMFTSIARARWQEMVVLFSRHNTAQEAESKMRWMGNQVANGASFEEIAKMKSDGFTAADGGIWDWTTRGSLTSAELEQAVFSQPLGQLSPRIIRSDRGLHIIRVLEREEAKVVPFVEAQVIIRERIKNQRTRQYQEEYLADLRRRYPTQVVRERIDFDINNTRSASSAW